MENNPILANLQKTSNTKTSIENCDILAEFKRSKNPQAFVYNVIMNNPDIKKIIDEYGDPKTAFFRTAEQRGIDPNTIINLLNNHF